MNGPGRLSAEQSAIAPLEFSDAYKAGVSPQAAWPFAKRNGAAQDSQQAEKVGDARPSPDAVPPINHQTKE